MKRKDIAVAAYGGTPAHWISVDDPITAKVASGRPQDLADVDVLRRVVARRAR